MIHGFRTYGWVDRKGVNAVALYVGSGFGKVVGAEWQIEPKFA